MLRCKNTVFCFLQCTCIIGISFLVASLSYSCILVSKDISNKGGILILR